jgi:hypothetical protein
MTNSMIGIPFIPLINTSRLDGCSNQSNVQNIRFTKNTFMPKFIMPWVALHKNLRVWAQAIKEMTTLTTTVKVSVKPEKTICCFYGIFANLTPSLLHFNTIMVLDNYL